MVEIKYELVTHNKIDINSRILVYRLIFLNSLKNEANNRYVVKLTPTANLHDEGANSIYGSRKKYAITLEKIIAEISNVNRTKTFVFLLKKPTPFHL